MGQSPFSFFKAVQIRRADYIIEIALLVILAEIFRFSAK